MPGTLVITTLSDGTNSTSTTNCIQGSAKAWVNFDGTTGSIRAQYNVSSVTRNATGQYTVNFTTAMSNTNYSAVATASLASSYSLNSVSDLGGTAYPLSTGSYKIWVGYNGWANYADAGAVCSAVFSS